MDTRKTQAADGTEHGPYESWQVALVVLVLGLMAVFVGHRRSVVVAPALAAMTLTVSFAIQAQADPNNDGLWPVGAILLAVGSFAAICLVALVTRIVEDHAVHR